VADGVDAPVKAMEAPGLEAALDLGAGESELQELR